ncbi:uncharacterized protein BO96DRAFT_335958 [Aspergillus niger CBS 101883]|uniref:Contig An01c0400, genomic contig n=2 Tax=Aspergillus niger TaxID=5061 RepID=A2QAZ8_ASPNC|nr:uncharacterized protein BO96DRAFT_335958 [Aspergillus niger CBS 101883]XP_059605917.1 uncharacterized protein An01g13360 [Aspergillus niger]PYH57306.1 hypothetical protein BO96DRAFT_335958 [Aspergillus niger CBS 101883]CAK96206.1 unnamed protein product [Aspergillus niger]
MPGKTKQGSAISTPLQSTRQRCWASQGVKHGADGAESSSRASVAISLLKGPLSLVVGWEVFLRPAERHRKRANRSLQPLANYDLRLIPLDQISPQPAFHGRNWGGRCSRSRVRRATLSSNQHPRPSRDLRKYQQKSPQALNGARLIGKLSWTTTTTTATNKTRNSNPGQTRRIACQSSPDDANVGGDPNTPGVNLAPLAPGQIPGNVRAHTLMRWPGTQSS